MSVVQLTVDLNKIVKKLASVVNDTVHSNQDIRKHASRFKQDIGEAEYLVGVACDRLVNSSKPEVGTLLREAIEITFEDLKRSHDELKSLLFKDEDVGLASSSSVSPVSSILGSATGRLRWAMGRKSTARNIFEDIKRSNDFLRRAIQDLELMSNESSPVMPSSESSESVTSGAARAGLLVQQTRLSIRRGRIPPDKTILRHPTMLDMKKGSLLEDDSSILTAEYVGLREVLVEAYHVVDFEESSERRAIQLAMMLSQPRVAGFSVLKCEGLVKNGSSNRYDFIFDVNGIIADLKEDGLPFSTATGPLPQFRSLNFHLSQKPVNDTKDKSDSNRDDRSCPRLFRYSNVVTDIPFRPISLLERLVFARSLAQTLSTLHLADWIHGNITSRNVAFFQDLGLSTSDQDCLASGQLGTSVTRLGRPYLFGFQFTRLVDEYSNHMSWTQVLRRDNVYRHPERQVHRRRSPEKPHAPLHDIYSLGVIFLEIGLGKTAEELFKTVKLAQSNLAVDSTSLSSELDASGASIQAGMIPPRISSQDVFLDFACRFLPETMGETFARVTQRCLSGNLQALDNDGKVVDGRAENSLKVEMTQSAAFWICIIEPLDRLIGAMSGI
jgi:hypothetical protein